MTVGEIGNVHDLQEWVVLGAKLRAVDPGRYETIVRIVQRINAGHDALDETRTQITRLISRIRKRDRTSPK